jgi:hypothetical protein
MAVAAGGIDRYISYGRYLPDLPENGVSNAVACRERICALRAPTVFLVRIRIIRTKNTVLDKGKNGLGLFLSKIADCVRTASRPRNVTTVQ